MAEDGPTYDAAGVSLATADAVVERLRAAVESTGATQFGQFAALHPLGDGRFLAASTDGVGTKLILARQRGALRACGADLAAHCINDVITCGAEPLILLDYVAASQIELEEVAELVEGAAEVCRAAGVALVGGETAELPGIYRDGELDFAGTCVGVVAEPLDGSAIEAGDVVLGFASAGLHANGFTLVAQGPRGGGLRRPRPAGADEALPRRRPQPARPGARVRPRDRRRHPRQPRARPPRPAAAPRSTGTRGSGRRSSTGSPATSRRTSCAASSTSASAGALSCATPSPETS